MLNNKALAASASAAKVYIEDVFSTYLYTGNGSTQTITNGIDLSGKGGLVWTKGRAAFSENHGLVDTARGTNKYLASNTSDGEGTGTQLTAFNNNGYTLGAVNGWEGNSAARPYASWTFRKAPKFFDVVTYTGDGSARTIPHNLGSVPGCIIVKRTDSSGYSWAVYHQNLSTASYYLLLQDTVPQASNSTVWNGTHPTSTVFSVGTSADTNESDGTYVAYLFAHNAGGFGDSGNDSVISCGSYTGNGSTTGPVVTLGWEPQWLLIKRRNSTGDWNLIDNMRGFAVEGTDAELNPNLLNAESTGTFITPLATGFQLNTTDTGYNASGGIYIYITIRRGPMKTPTDATKFFDLNATGPSSASGVFQEFGDASLLRRRDQIFDWRFFSRLLGVPPSGGTGNYLSTNTTSGNTSYTATGNLICSVSNNFLNSTIFSGVAYSFRRAPSFFDVVAYTGDGSSSRLISHNLGVPPELIITKRRDSTSTTGWFVSSKYYYVSTPWDRNGRLNDGTIGFSGGGVYEPASSHSSTVYPLSTNIADLNGSGGTYVAYLFASCPGVSKCGIYTGTGTTQQINCNFTSGARFVLIKRTDSTGDWYVWDSARGIIAGNDPYLLLNSTAVEVTGTDYIDTYAAGFEISSTAPAAINANGGSFIYLAIA